MKICLVLEGSYPYTKGGVSNWVDTFIAHQPEHEFVLWTIADLISRKDQYLYKIPSNVIEINENFLEASLKLRTRREAHLRLSDYEKSVIGELLRCGDPEWSTLLDIFQNKKINPVEFLMSEDFLSILKDFARKEFPFIGFSDLFWTVRSMFLPLFYLIGQPIPEADVYHSMSSGYAGVMGALAAKKYNKPFILTEHGIYTREREEEILRSDWALSSFKDLWNSMFYMYARFAYKTAHQVTSLFSRASETQQELGCPPDKCVVISNGIEVDDYTSIPLKEPDGWIDIGAFARVAQIKDLKTMIYTFSRLKQTFAKTRLHILGGIDDENYYKECLALIDFLGVPDVTFHGIVNTQYFMKKIDFTILTSISEGQPFAIIESMAARRPVVATSVGACPELINGDEGDEFGSAGFCVSPMNQDALYKAMLKMCNNEELRLKMGEIGQKRVIAFYDHRLMINKYEDIYREAIKIWQESVSN